MGGRERVGPGLECVYGAEVTVLACYVNLGLGIFSLPGHCEVILIPSCV